MNGLALNIYRDELMLAATHYGSQEMPLVILLHGFPDTPHSWDGVVPELVSAGYQVLTPWLRGYTASSVNRNARYDLLAVAEDIDAWRQHLGAKKAHIVGHDWGAFAAMLLANENPSAWQSLSVLAVPPFGNPSDLIPAALPALLRQLWLSSYVPAMQSELFSQLLSFNRAAIVERIWQRWSPGWKFSEQCFAPVRAAFSDPNIAWATTRYYRSLFTLHRKPTRQFYKKLAQLSSLPTLTLAGLNDGCMNIAMHKALTDASPIHNLRSIYLQGCGHFLHAELPEIVAQDLLLHFKSSELNLV